MIGPLKDYARSKLGASVVYKEEWDTNRFLIDQKMFGMIGVDDKNRQTLTLKLRPEYGAELRLVYQDVIVPGYYMNKTHWNTLYLDKMDQKKALSFIYTLIDESYELIFKGLTKKRQKEILEQGSEDHV